MALNIKDSETERLAAELAASTGQSKTSVIREALRESKLHASPAQETAEDRYQRLHRFLEVEVWSELPQEELGKPVSKQEREDILGFGPDGV